MPLVALIALNVAIRYVTDPHVRTIAVTFRQCAPLIATAGELQFLNGSEIDPIVGSLRSELAGLRRLKLISRWINGNPLMLSTGSGPLAIAVSDVVGAVYEYLNLALLLDGTGLYFGLRDLSRAGGSLVRVAAAAGEVDAAISVASYRAGRQDCIRPEFLPGAAALDLVDVCHPLLERAVPNSITVRPGHGVLVTGSNMSAIVYVEGSDLSSFREINGNVWDIPQTLSYAEGGYFYIWDSWSNKSGYRTPQEWDAFAQVGTDFYREMSLTTGAQVTIGNLVAGADT